MWNRDGSQSQVLKKTIFLLSTTVTYLAFVFSLWQTTKCEVMPIFTRHPWVEFWWGLEVKLNFIWCWGNICYFRPRLARNDGNWINMVVLFVGLATKEFTIIIPRIWVCKILRNVKHRNTATYKISKQPLVFHSTPTKEILIC